MKPSPNEEEYFARQEAARKRKLAEQRQAKLLAERGARQMHYMKCPKCGIRLDEMLFDGVRVDKCSGCEGLWLDRGELESIRNNGSALARALPSLFRR